MSYQNILNSRLQSCLETILELEGCLDGKSSSGKVVGNEFAVLREAFERLSAASVNEQDVTQIEVATARFLSDIQQTLADAQTGQWAGKRSLQ